MKQSAPRNRSRLRPTALRFCLISYPRHFRESFGAAIAETFSDRTSAAKRHGVYTFIVTVVSELYDILKNGLVMRVQHRRRQSEIGRAARHGATGRWIDPLRHDVIASVRSVWRRPGTALIAIVLLGAGIGLNTAMFSLIDAYLLRSLPYPDADRLVTVSPITPGANPSLRATIPEGLQQIDWPLRDAVFDDLITWDLDDFTVIGEGHPEVFRGAWVPPSYLRALRTNPALGRLFTDADGQPDAPSVMVIGYGVWQRRFGGDPDIIGRTVSAYGSDRPFESETFTIIGVLPEDFWFINTSTEVLANLREHRAPYMLRLSAGTTTTQAADHLTQIVRSRIDGVDPSWPGMYVESTHDQHVQRVRPILIVLAVAAGFVLMISCGNVALLLTVKALARHREIGIRMALGASRRRVVQQLAVEGMMLATGACLGGLLLSWGVLKAFGPLIQEQLRTSVPGGIDALSLNGAALGLTIILSALTGLAFTLIPALTTTRGELATSIRESATNNSESRTRHWTRNTVIALEVAISLVLTVGAGLMLRTAVQLNKIELGFDAAPVMTANINLRQRGYPEDAQLTQFVNAYLTSLRSRPGIESASMLAGWPFQDRMGSIVTPEESRDVSGVNAATYVVSDGYFETMSIRILRGRGFQASDQTTSAPVTILSESLARQILPGRDPIGRRVKLEAEGDAASWRTVVGVAADVRETLTGDEQPDVYLAYAQSPSPFLFSIVNSRTPDGMADAIQQALWEVDASAAANRIIPMSDLVSGQRARQRFLATLLTAFGFLAVTLALVGLYSTIAYAVRQRRREVAIHMALGAHGNTVVGLFLRKAVGVIAVGTVAGIVASAALTRSLASQLYGVTPMDGRAYVLATVLLLVAALVASWLPARRAVKVDPVGILRED